MLGLGGNGWMNGVLGHFYALSRLNWAGDNLAWWERLAPKPLDM